MEDTCVHKVIKNFDEIIERRYETPNILNSYKNNKRLYSEYNVARKNDSSVTFRCRRPSLQSRIQNGKSLELCFINEHISETDDHIDEVLSLPIVSYSKYTMNNSNDKSMPVVNEEISSSTKSLISCNINSKNNTNDDRNNNITNRNYCARNLEEKKNMDSLNRLNINWDVTKSASDFRKEVCDTLKKIYADTHDQMKMEHQRSESPITCTIKSSLKKIGFEDDNKYKGHRRMNRHMLTNMNANQLQIIIGDLQAHIQYLNEQLMQMLVERDELHMSRDSLLVDIEDFKAYL